MGVLSAYEAIPDDKYLKSAKRGWDYMEKHFWSDGPGIYLSRLKGESLTYTPLTAGVTIGALSRLSRRLPEEKELILNRLASFAGRILIQAGMEIHPDSNFSAKNLISDTASNPVVKKDPSKISKPGFPLLAGEINIKLPAKQRDGKEYIYDVVLVKDLKEPPDMETNLYASIEMLLCGNLSAEGAQGPTGFFLKESSRYASANLKESPLSKKDNAKDEI